MSQRKPSAALVIAIVPLLVIGVVFNIMLIGGSDYSCALVSGSVTIDPDTVPDNTIAGYGHEQLVNAAHIIQAGKDLGLAARDQTIGVMTAMGESSLRNIEHGDWETGGVTNPDGSRTTSIGLFQQQNGWGTREERLDPYLASKKFFEALTNAVPDTERQTLEPTIIAHRTQRNADPYHYTKFWNAAVQVVEELSGVTTGLNGGGSCGFAPGQVNKDGWAAPSAGAITSPYGWRIHPIYGDRRFHYGIDLASGCDSPIWAAQTGTVTAAGFDTRYGSNGTIIIDHGGGIETVYLHMYASGFLVKVGDKVTGGQQIGKEGSSGESTGCHLHLEVHVNGDTVDPAAFMAGVGITLGQ